MAARSGLTGPPLATRMTDPGVIGRPLVSTKPGMVRAMMGSQREGSKCTRLSPASQAMEAAPGTISALPPSVLVSGGELVGAGHAIQPADGRTGEHGAGRQVRGKPAADDPRRLVQRATGGAGDQQVDAAGKGLGGGAGGKRAGNRQREPGEQLAAGRVGHDA